MFAFSLWHTGSKDSSHSLGRGSHSLGRGSLLEPGHLANGYITEENDPSPPVVINCQWPPPFVMGLWLGSDLWESDAENSCVI